MRKRILLTGASGLIGRHIVPLLDPSFDLLLTDRLEGMVGEQKVHSLDITDYEAVAAAVEGVDAIIHLAIASSRQYVTDTPLFDSDDGEEYLKFNQAAIDVNMRGTYNLFEAARQKGVKRVVFASSLTVLIGKPRRDYIHDDLPLQPSNFYAVTKMFCENLGEFFYRRHGVESVAIRLGTPFPQPWEPKSASWLKSPNGKRTFISFRDIAGALSASVNAPWKAYAPFTIVSHAENLGYDLSRAKEIIGWEPADHFDAEGRLIALSELKV